MNDRPTPETDAEHAQFAMGRFTLDFCRKLERERDIAREDAKKSKAYKRVLKVTNAVLKRERDEARKICQLAHDRILRGDNDREILDILAKGWRAAK